jgi:hypothetical protein
MHPPAAALPDRDRKRFAWRPSLPVPMGVAVGPVPCRAWPQAAMLWPAVIFVHCVAPLIDLRQARAPPLWFALMDARLVAAVHSDAARIDVHPPRRTALTAPMRRHGLREAPTSPTEASRRSTTTRKRQA